MNEQLESPPSFMSLVAVPVMSQVRFSEMTGVSLGVIEGWINRGYIPTVLVGKHRLINMVLLTQDCLNQLDK